MGFDQVCGGGPEVSVLLWLGGAVLQCRGHDEACTGHLSQQQCAIVVTITRMVFIIVLKHSLVAIITVTVIMAMMVVHS